MNLNSALLACLGTFFSVSASGRELSPQQADALPGSSPVPAHSPFTAQYPGDDDFGHISLLGDDEQASAMTMELSGSYFWTNNARLHPDTKREDWVFSPLARLTYTPTLGDGLLGEATIRYQHFLYDENSDIDFDALYIGGGLVASLPWLLETNAFLRYQYLRLGDSGDELYATHSIQAGLFRDLELTQDHALFASYYSDFSLNGSPDSLRHHSHEAMLGWRWRLSATLEWNAYYRFELEDYTSGGRRDVAHTVGALLEWSPTEWLALQPFISFTRNNSNVADFDHEVLNVGAFLVLKHSF